MFVGAVEAEPLRVDGFVVRVLLDADLASDGFEQVVVHHLVDAVAGHGEPVVDDAERHEGPALDAGLLLHLAFRGLDERLTGFDVALRQAPLDASGAIVARDESEVGLVVANVDDDAARRDLLERRKARSPVHAVRGDGHSHTLTRGFGVCARARPQAPA